MTILKYCECNSAKCRLMIVDEDYQRFDAYPSRIKQEKTGVYTHAIRHVLCDDDYLQLVEIYRDTKLVIFDDFH